MEETKTATATTETIAPQTTAEVVTVPQNEDYEAKMKVLEAEKARLIEEGANYKVAYLKEKSKNKEDYVDDDEEERIRRITRETLADSELARIAQEQDSLIKKALKENTELKLAVLNKTNTPPAAVGTHSEATPVTDTLVTPEQISAFKARGWTEKDIERYKNNLRKYGGR